MKILTSSSYVPTHDKVSSINKWSDFLEFNSREILERPKKSIRSKLIEIGFLFASKNEKPTPSQKQNLEYFSEVLELIHTGSLIIDDIQDDSPLRRGKPPLHVNIGTPQAINTGNWMYFKALADIQNLSTSQNTKNILTAITIETMKDAHIGQAIDLGESMLSLKSPLQIIDTVKASHSLKSGGLVRLALMAGAIIHNENQDYAELGDLGVCLGTALQQFDDIGNIKFNSEDPKSLEDLKLGRPTFIWSFISEYSPDLLLEFRDLVKNLHEEDLLESFLVKNNILSKAYLIALKNIKSIEQKIESLCSSNSSESLTKEFTNITEKIANAYK
jgi:geranylgeranyl pyrophosphate synthase